ncbi:MAG: hypothetical protein N2202_00085 [Proteobacteria bacterium]|nr:hypothetical protein [Pseudomonadota bacterium]
MNPTNSKNFVNSMKPKSIPKKRIIPSKKFLVFYETLHYDQSKFMFLEYEKKLYPLNNFRVLKKFIESKEKIFGIMFQNPIDFINILKIFFRENSFNPIEKIQLSKFILYFDLKELVPNLDVEEFIKNEQILSLPDEAQDMIARSIIPLDLASKLNNLEPSLLFKFLKIIDELKLTQSQQREFFQFLQEKNEISDKEVFSNIEKIKNRDLLVETIRALSLPQYTKTKRLFDQNKKKINLPSKINLVETPFFESKNLKIEIFFKNYVELNDRIRKLLKNVDEKKDLWEKIFDIL